MGILADLVKDFFVRNDWEYEQGEDNEGAFCAGVSTDNADFDVVVIADDSINQLTCFCVHEDEIEEDRRLAVAEYMVRVNANTVLGVYDMDFDDGTLRVRSAINIADMQPSMKMVEIMIHGIISTADVYFPGLKKVVSGEATPEDALDEVIQSINDEFFSENN